MKFIKSIMARIFGTASVDSVVSQFTKTIDRLDVLHVAHLEAVAAHREAVRKAQEAERMAAGEALRAASISAKIKELLA